MTETKENKESSKSSLSQLSPPPGMAKKATTALELATYPIAAFAGYSTFDTTVRREMYANFAKKGVFNEAQKRRSEKYAQAIEASEKNGLEGERFARTINRIENEYREEVRQFFEGKGIKHLTEYWELLQRNQRVRAVEITGTVAGIALGSLLAVSQNHHLSEFFVNLQKEKEEKEKERNGGKGM